MKRLMKEIWHPYEKKSIGKNTPLMIFISAAFIWCILTMLYVDIPIIIQYGISLWDSLLDGVPFNFYTNAIASGINGSEGAVYEFGMYVIFGIWGLPVWILHKLMGLSLLSTVSVIWFKLLLCLFECLTANLVYLIARKMNIRESTSNLIQIFFFVTSYTFLPIYSAQQVDIIPLFFMMAGIYSFLEEDWKSFWLFFGISVITKPFAIFELFLLAVLKNKDFKGLFKDFMIGFSPYIVLKILCNLFDQGYRSNNGYNQKMLSVFFSASVPGGQADISLFMLSASLIYILAWHYSYDKKNLAETIIQYSLLIWLSFASFATIFPYWELYLAPFIVLAPFSWKKDIKRNLIIELVMELCYSAALILNYGWVYGGEEEYSSLLLKPVYELILRAGKQPVPVKMGLEYLQINVLTIPGIYGIYIGCAVFFACCALRYIFSEEKCSAAIIEDCEFQNHLKIRVFLMWGWILLTLAALVKGFVI